MEIPLKELISDADKLGDRVARSKALRTILWLIGTISLVLGVIGIFLPLLPTTPFLLLTAICYLRSSTRLYSWLISHPHLGQYVLAYLNGSGVPIKAKFYTLFLLWLSMSFSIYVVPLWQVKVVLILLALSVSIYIWQLPNSEKTQV